MGQMALYVVFEVTPQKRRALMRSKWRLILDQILAKSFLYKQEEDPNHRIIVKGCATTRSIGCIDIVFVVSCCVIILYNEAKTNEGLSLNECLYKGPVMLPSLIGILLRAKQRRYLLTLLAAVIRHLLSEESSKLSIEIAKIFHVDNVVLTSESESESIKKAKEAKELFKRVKMQLREFQIPQGGLQTKREILQFHAAIYDPLGLLGPIIFPWKLLIQDLWKKGMLWDEKLEPEEMRRCLELVKHSTNLMSWKYHDGRLKNTPIYMYASEKAVGLAIYARRSSSMPRKP
uniref:Uncharacterized protein n=1 Tax=Onchocerca volvulus TaxID=6282 RepID=A0A8R1XQK2_ONCVO